MGAVILVHSNISILHSRNVLPHGASFTGKRLSEIENVYSKQYILHTKVNFFLKKLGGHSLMDSWCYGT